MSSFRRRLMMAQGGGEPFVVEPCIYTTETANQNIVIASGSRVSIKKIWLEDGTQLDVNSGEFSLTHTFSNIGQHKVWIEFKREATDFSSVFYKCINLTSVPDNLFANCINMQSCWSLFSGCSKLKYIPDNLFVNNPNIYDFTFCFATCTGITTIPNKLFANNIKVDSFSGCFSGCKNITSSCPIDNDGTPIYNRSGSGKEGYTNVRIYDRCFSECTKMKDYASIPSSWK